MEEFDNNFISLKNKSSLISFEIPAGEDEVSDFSNFLNILVKANVFDNRITKKSQVNTNQVLRFNDNSFFVTKLGFS